MCSSDLVIHHQEARFRNCPHEVMKLSFDSSKIIEDVRVIELQVVQDGGAWPVVHELRPLVEERGVVFVRFNDEMRSAAGPRGHAEVVRHAVCLYEMSPDGHFVLDRLPGVPQVIVGAGFSGHGFKFAPVVGEILADYAQSGQTRRSAAFLSARRDAGLASS